MKHFSLVARFVSLLVSLSGAVAGCSTAAPVVEAVAAPTPVAPVAPPPAPDPSLPPDAFAHEVVCADLFELKLGGIAQSRCHAPEVKEYARRMVVNHTAIEEIMTRIAIDESLALPSTIAAADGAVIAQLAALKGIEFDKAYMTIMVARHAKTLEMFRWQYDNCSNASLKTFAVQTMPIIGVHARAADALNAEVNKEEIAAAEAARVAAIAAAEAARLEAAMAQAQAQADAQAKSQRGSRRSRAPKPIAVAVPVSAPASTPPTP